mmetsp:Transcript_13377/g.28553  ORF Transcript_13377/g.28553 Transcript_13377/m.28553 type:complete len:88 (+) Transcript_13377:199-462(+)
MLEAQIVILYWIDASQLHIYFFVGSRDQRSSSNNFLASVAFATKETKVRKETRDLNISPAQNATRRFVISNRALLFIRADNDAGNST